MQVYDAKVQTVMVPKGTKVLRNGQVKEVRIPARIGLVCMVDDVKVTYNFKHHKYAVTHKDKPVTFRNGRPTGEMEKGSRFGGMTRAEFVRQHGEAFVKLVDNAFHPLIMGLS